MFSTSLPLLSPPWSTHSPTTSERPGEHLYQLFYELYLQRDVFCISPPAPIRVAWCLRSGSFLQLHSAGSWSEVSWYLV